MAVKVPARYARCAPLVSSPPGQFATIASCFSPTPLCPPPARPRVHRPCLPGPAGEITTLAPQGWRGPYVPPLVSPSGGAQFGVQVPVGPALRILVTPRRGDRGPRVCGRRGGLGGGWPRHKLRWRCLRGGVVIKTIMMIRVGPAEYVKFCTRKKRFLNCCIFLEFFRIKHKAGPESGNHFPESYFPVVV